LERSDDGPGFIDGQLCRVIMVDITERRQAAKKLAQTYEEVEARVIQRTRDLIESNKALELEVLSRRTAEETLRQKIRGIKRQSHPSRGIEHCTESSAQAAGGG
jgi:metal-responsive CopG/Arc/MetJ family transcriptional regulator